jgi:hypothetical protein
VLKELTMKYAAIPAAILALVFTFSAASAHMMSCSGDLSKMTTMMAGMPDGPHKWEMNKHLAMLNAAMARDGTRGCSMAMKQMMGGSKMGMMKSGM